MHSPPATVTKVRSTLLQYKHMGIKRKTNVLEQMATGLARYHSKWAYLESSQSLFCAKTHRIKDQETFLIKKFLFIFSTFYTISLVSSTSLNINGPMSQYFQF